jgi:hypothetical protein
MRVSDVLLTVTVVEKNAREHIVRCVCCDRLNERQTSCCCCSKTSIRACCCDRVERKAEVGAVVVTRQSEAARGAGRAHTVVVAGSATSRRVLLSLKCLLLLQVQSVLFVFLSSCATIVTKIGSCSVFVHTRMLL